jgi:hypothetical protein
MGGGPWGFGQILLLGVVRKSRGSPFSCFIAFLCDHFSDIIPWGQSNQNSMSDRKKERRKKEKKKEELENVCQEHKSVLVVSKMVYWRKKKCSRNTSDYQGAEVSTTTKNYVSTDTEIHSQQMN